MNDLATVRRCDFCGALSLDWVTVDLLDGAGGIARYCGSVCRDAGEVRHALRAKKRDPFDVFAEEVTKTVVNPKDDIFFKTIEFEQED